MAYRISSPLNDVIRKEFWDAPTCFQNRLERKILGPVSFFVEGFKIMQNFTFNGSEWGYWFFFWREYFRKTISPFFCCRETMEEGWFSLPNLNQFNLSFWIKFLSSKECNVIKAPLTARWIYSVKDSLLYSAFASKNLNSGIRSFSFPCLSFT